MLLLLAANSLGAEELHFERPLMGTRFRIVCHVGDPALTTQASKAVDRAYAIAEELNATASDYLPESELSRLNTQTMATPLVLSESLYDLLDHSRRLAAATDAAFDPTLGPLTKLWRETRNDHRLPDPETLRAARATVGWRCENPDFARSSSHSTFR